MSDSCGLHPGLGGKRGGERERGRGGEGEMEIAWLCLTVTYMPCLDWDLDMYNTTCLSLMNELVSLVTNNSWFAL